MEYFGFEAVRFWHDGCSKTYDALGSYETPDEKESLDKNVLEFDKSVDTKVIAHEKINIDHCRLSLSC